VRDIFKRPAHPYTQALLGALPDAQARSQRLEAIPGRVPSPLMLPRGCAFAPRCKRRFEPCEELPPLFEVQGQQRAACFLHDPRRTPTRR
jgi:oligopeptide/dipeptide ABC transporter ATP-binding protein